MYKGRLQVSLLGEAMDHARVDGVILGLDPLAHGEGSSLRRIGQSARHASGLHGLDKEALVASGRLANH